ncbi:hypothetical protein [Mycobacteroides abscessus]|nr:hypothetical protein [Mycobacteroides abscessus]EHM20872.1 hypothetical protein MMAS_06900 [Mycobacteroides abscessus subsp. massiliense CCUG 48898 = JCM 15300]EIV69044.1 putative oxidoreductase domain protein [Mycobacteroides abscessus subsp. massiliense CCUG 48898 = JCM 15300]MBN7424577.1 oxidoreductase [Mycobacteroides abscessus subsp. massiliense]MBN7465763.1 oxidoreductase [Mycobacteroides abscessus subsp. massiliense]MBN7564876.1 oxidoreductase [Mycobacteroides abscessus subsp. massil
MWQPTGRHIGLIQEDQLPQILDAAVPVIPRADGGIPLIV